MKKLAICLVMTCLSLTLVPLQLNAATKSDPTAVPAPKPAESSEVKALELRLNEINAMDKSKMKSAEKKSLRKEVKSINHKMRDITGGVYVSAGVLILVLILLIVLL
jgi:hypothetical protein